MRNAKTRLVSLLIAVILILSVTTLSSCDKRIKFDEAEVVAAARTLLKEAEFLNEVYYGSGIEYTENEDYDIGYYSRASSAHLEILGFSTIDELKVITEKTFSDGYSSLLYSTILGNLTDDTSIVSAARYFQNHNEETKESYIMVRSTYIPMFKDTIVYDYDSLRAEGSNKEKVFVSVNATVTNSDGKSQTVTLTVNLVEESDGWKIDNPTYANYNELKDRYDELKDQDIK